MLRSTSNWPGPQVGRQSLHRRRHHVRVGVEVFVDRRTDHDHHVLGTADDPGSVVGVSREPSITRLSASGAPGSSKGITPELTMSTAMGSRS